MKTWTHYLVPALALAAALPVVRAADDEKPQPKEKRSQLRVLAGPERERRVIVQHGDRMEKENVTFLGVEAGAAPAALAAQLGLARGTGLVVGHVAPKSPADGVLQTHDVLLKLDDQILIEPHQLFVLVRNHQQGDEVTLTYLRGGRQATAKVKLGTHEALKVSALEGSPAARAFAYANSGAGDSRVEFHGPRPDGLESEEWNRVLGLLQRSPGAPDGGPGFVPPGARIRIDHGSGPGFRAMSINAGNSSLAYSDDEGSLELTMKDGTKTLVAKDAQGKELFSGPVTTPAERKAMPAPVRERLEKMEGMHDVTFRTDGDFKGGEMRVLPFPPREISLPRKPASDQPARAAASF